MNGNEFEKFEARRQEVSIAAVRKCLEPNNTLDTAVVLAARNDWEVWQAAYLASAKRMRERCVGFCESCNPAASPLGVAAMMATLPLEEEP